MKHGSSSVVPTTICFTSMLPPFSRGGMVRRHLSFWLPFGPQISAGRAPVGCGGRATPPASPSCVSRFSHVSISGLPGSTPTDPMNPLKGTRTPGIWSDTASMRLSFQLAMNGFG